MFQNTKQIILKVTRGCNIACKYCYVHDKPFLAKEEMSDELFDFIMRRWLSETKHGDLNAKNNNFANELSLVFHGGEPLLIGKQKFARFAKKAKQYAEIYNKKLEIALQTNSTLIDDDWIAIFKMFNVSPGISFDGIYQTEDLRSSTSYKTMSKIIEMRNKGVKTGPLMVLHKNNYKNIILELRNLMSSGITSIKINRGVDVRPEQHDDYELNADELLEYTEAVMNFMFNNNFVEDNLMGQMILYYNHSNKQNGNSTNRTTKFDHCYSRFCGGMKNLMEIEPDGTFQFCGRASKRTDETVGGTVFDKDILEFSMIDQQWNFLKGRLETIKNNRCNECPSQIICDGGCIAFSHQKIGKAMVDPITCKYFKGVGKLFDKYDREIGELIRRRTQQQPNSNKHTDEYLNRDNDENGCGCKI